MTLQLSVLVHGIEKAANFREARLTHKLNGVRCLHFELLLVLGTHILRCGNLQPIIVVITTHCEVHLSHLPILNVLGF